MPVVRNYPPVIAIYGRKKQEHINPNLTTKPMTRQKKEKIWHNEKK